MAITSTLQSGRVDGVILSLCGTTQDIRHLLELQQRNIPLVFFDRVSDNITAPKVMTNDYESGFVATEHLVKAGCRTIAHLTISMSLSISHRRQEGYTDSLRRWDLPCDPGMIVHCTTHQSESHLLLQHLF